MSAPAIFEATYSDMKIVRSRKVMQVIVEMPIENGQKFVSAFGMPSPGEETWVALARLDPKAKDKPAPKESKRWDQMSSAQQAGIRCAEKSFQAFIADRRGSPCLSADDAADFVRGFCGVESRASIDGTIGASASWRALDGEYLEWMRYGA
jgi:hypothetical protein